jgi:hypothetical protein
MNDPKEKLNEAINNRFVSRKYLSEARVQMQTVYITKNTQKIRNAIMKWAKANDVPFLYVDPFHSGGKYPAVSVAADRTQDLTDEFDASYIKSFGGTQEYMRKKDMIKAVGGAGGKQTRGAFGGYKPDYERMWSKQQGV